jgi:DNA-binding response OmpR family regulator
MHLRANEIRSKRSPEATLIHVDTRISDLRRSGRCKLMANMSSVRILILEDDPRTLEVFSQALRRVGFEVQAVRTMAAAIEALNARRYTAILTNLGLPDIAPSDVLAGLRATAPGSRIIVCSGLITEELQGIARQFGAVAVLEKPVGLDRLVNTVAAAA